MTAPVTRQVGDLAVATLAGYGVDTMFTLNGGHVWPLYDGARAYGVRVVDTRHEQSATWAAEGWAKLTRRPGLGVLTAGPGVTNGVSAITSAHFNGAPLVVLGGRASQDRWGWGSLQEIDHVPIVASVTKSATTVTDPSEIAAVVHSSVLTALTPHRGPVFVDIPIDVLFAGADGDVPEPGQPARMEPDPEEVARVAEIVAGALRPVVVAGSDVYWAGAWDALRRAVERLRVPCFANGMGRGCLPADHELSFNRTRGLLRTEADLVVVVGTPLDFRLGFGRFGDARVVHVVDHPLGLARHVPTAATAAGDIASILDGLAAWTGRAADHEPWVARLSDAERAAASADRALLEAADEPIRPTRVLGELKRRLSRDAVVICDGGDFASYAGKHLDAHAPGNWLDTGPYGCLGNGPGYAIAARSARPSAQVVALLGDGAAGFSLMEVDTMVRHRLPAVLIIGNNGIWGLEKHPMRAVYGWDMACDLQPGCRYDQVAVALGGGGELVRDPRDIGPALDRAFASDVPYVINVVTDPDDAYPRTSNLG
ncbi:MAG TPA: acetolactate synthase [Acidimicrobiales bacterium]|nr:acetolactate synthase [Acidimicrobiales bacterium]